MDMVVEARLKNEEHFMLRFGVDEIPQADWAWSVIDGKDGGKVQHDDCASGYHEFVWMEKVWEYVCFFCLTVDEYSSGDESSMDSLDRRFFGCEGPGEGGKMVDDLEPMADTDSQNEADEDGA